MAELYLLSDSTIIEISKNKKNRQKKNDWQRYSIFANVCTKRNQDMKTQSPVGVCNSRFITKILYQES